MAQVNPDMTMRIPRGTKMCPVNRANTVAGCTEYYIVIDEDVDAIVSSGFKFTLEGTCAIRFQQNDNLDELYAKFADEQTKMQHIKIQNGTRYYVSDEKRDPIGLPKRLECQTEFVIMPGSKIVLNPNVTVLTYTTKKRLQTAEVHDVVVY